MKEKIGIVTDSTCDLPKEILARYGIEVIPLQIIYRDRQYRDGVDISSEEVYDALSKEIPTTSSPVPEDVESLFNRMKEQGFTHVVAIHISSGLSGTSQMIQTMADRAKGLVVRVIDSRSISAGLGLMVVEAAKAVEKQMGFEAVCRHVSEVRQRLSVYFVLGTLEYLRKGGRIGKVAGTLGQMLNLKPIITVNPEGIYTTYAKVRGRKQSVEKLLSIAREHLSRAVSNVAVCHGDAKEEAASFVRKLEELPNLRQLIQNTVSPVIGVHTGPGTLGFAVLELNE